MSSVMAQSMTCTPLLTSLLGNATTPSLNAIPAGFPVNRDGKSAWIGSKILDRDFVYNLTDAERAEIYMATISFKGECQSTLILPRSPLSTPLPLPVTCRPHLLGQTWY
jgi:hypothetical protein